MRLPDSGLSRHVAGFLVVGAIAFGIDLGVFWMLVEAGMEPAPTAAFSLFVAGCANYQMSGRWVFGFGGRSRLASFGLFFLGVAAGMAASALLVAVLPPSTGMPVLAAKLVASVGVTFWNFWFRRQVIFRAGRLA